MKIYFNLGDSNFISEFSLEADSYFKYQTDIDDELFDDFTNDFFNYAFENEILSKPYDCERLKERAKEECLEIFNLYVDAFNRDTKAEDDLDAQCFDELKNYIVNQQFATPITDMLIKSLGIDDIHQYKLNLYQGLLHKYLAIADLIGQKNQMFQIIDECEDGEMLESMEFNFSWLSYSNMRWR